MCNTFPEGWKVVPLGELCLGVRGVTYKPDDLSPVKTDQTVTLLRSNNIQSGRLDLADVQNVDQAKVSVKQIAEEGDIAVCMSNGSKRLVGKSAVFRNIPNTTKYTVGAFCSIFRPYKSVSAGFIAQLFNSDQFQGQVDFSLAGSAINNLKNSDVIRYRFAQPPPPEQKKIAAILSSIDDVIEKTRAQIDKLKDLKTGMMQELLTKGIGHTEFKDSPVGRIPVVWKVKSTGQLCKSIVPGRSKPASMSGDIPWLTVNDLGSLYVNKSKLGYGVTKQVIADVNGKVVPKSAVIMSCVGEFGIASVTKREVVINQQLHGFVCGSEIIPEYLCFVLGAKSKEMLNLATQTTIAYMNKANCESVLIPVPPTSEQRKIVDVIASVDLKLQKLSRKKLSVTATKKALMQDLLTGKVRVNVTTDQTESVVA